MYRKIICFGDSNTWGYDPRGPLGDRYEKIWPDLLEKILKNAVINWGENGLEIPTSTITFPLDMDLLIIMLGTNDLLEGKNAEDVCKKMEVFLMQQALEYQKVLLIVPPALKVGAWVQNTALVRESAILADSYRELSERLNTHFIDAGQWNLDLAFDGVHLTEEAHERFAENLSSFLNSLQTNAGL